MALTISEKRYSEIKAGVERQRAEAKLAEIEATDLDAQPSFQSVDAFLAFADSLAEHPVDRPARSRRKRQ